jgi:hypothetical protein
MQEPETAREAAKAFIQPYVLDGWKMEELTKKQPRTDRDEYAARIGGGKVTDHRGQEHPVSREQIAVTRVGAAPCWGVFDLAHLMAEIRDEHRGYEQQTLAAIFAEQDRIEEAEREDEALRQAIAPAQHKRPAIFRAYNAGDCQHCGEPLGYIEADGGRDRLYCNNRGKCKVAHHRKLAKEKKREQILQYHGELRHYWQEHGIRGEVLSRLQEILIQHGRKAAKAATDAVLVALAANEQAGSQEQFRLMDEIMLGGEALGFPEVKQDEFRISAGVQGWTDFVSCTTISFLRQMRGYLYDLQRQEQQKIQARKRLEALSRDQEPQRSAPQE